MNPVFKLIGGFTAATLFAAGAFFALRSPVNSNAQTKKTMTSIYDIPLKTIDGKPATLAAYKGKVLLIVNVASA